MSNISLNSALLDIGKIRADFPILQRQVNGKPLVYLDSAATTQKPNQVIDAISHYYRHYNSNIHRGVHQLSQEATTAFEGVREQVRRFIGAASSKEIIFTSGTTESNNLITMCYARSVLKAGDEVLISHMEHHSNIVPWQLICEATGAKLKVTPINDEGELDMLAYHELLSERTAIVAMTYVSNALGTLNPVGEIVAAAHEKGAVVLLDGAQAVPHLKVDMQDLGVDFFTFSAHKMYGPTGVGVLYGRQALLEKMPPFKGGGDMIRMVSFEKTLYNELPYKFEAGTPNIAGVIGMGAAIDYLEGLGLEAVAAHEHALLEYGNQLLTKMPGLRMIGTAAERAAVLNFVLEYAHPHDIGTFLDHAGIAVRTGHHCAQPVMDRYQVPATVRASLGVYNTKADLDALVRGIEKVYEVFGQ